MKKTLFIPFLFAIGLTLTACSSRPRTNVADNEVQVAPVTKAQIEALPTKKYIPDIKKCTCVQLWMPVCGENGKTYSNSCFANCAGVKFKQGPCPIED
ncbi:MAG: Kazal-type serine protease inhibitor domain-containing protein [Bacteriovorax sp.]